MCARSVSDTILVVYGGIWPVGCRTYLEKAANEIGRGPSLGPVAVDPCAS